MDSYLSIVADIKTRLEALDAGRVHDYERQSADPAKFIGLFRHANRILGWEISRRAVAEHVAGVHFRHHQMVLRGYMGLEDAAATSKQFQVLIERVCAAFRTNTTPPGVPWQYRNGDVPQNAPAQVEVIDDRMFGAVLCHHAQIALSVTERILV